MKFFFLIFFLTKKALRTLAEAEATAFQEHPSKLSRVGRQEAAESGGSGGSEAAESEGGAESADEDSATETTEKATTPLNGLSTAVKINQNVSVSLLPISNFF